MPAGSVVCPCRPAVTELSVRRRMRIYPDASTNWHWSAGVLATVASGSCSAAKGWQKTSAAAPSDGAQSDLVDGFRHGRIGYRSQDQEPYQRGRLHEGMPDGHCCLWEFRRQVTRILDSIALFRVHSATIRTYQGPEFICRALDQWAFEHGVELRLIQPSQPTQNGFIESFNGRFAMNA